MHIVRTMDCVDIVEVADLVDDVDIVDIVHIVDITKVMDRRALPNVTDFFLMISWWRRRACSYSHALS